MTSPEDSVVSTGSKISTILRLKPQLIEKLAPCLDRETRLIPNWKHLAWELEVDPNVIRRLRCYGDFSPTIRLFEFLETQKPDLTIRQLKDALLEIKRNDLIGLLTSKAGCTDSDKVIDVITSPSEDSPSPRADLLDKIAVELDGTSLGLSNWYTLATKLGVPRKKCLAFERGSTENPTGRLFQYLAAKCPQLTLASLREALDSMERKDLMNFLQELNQGDEVLLKDVMTPGSEVLERLSEKLNRERVPGVKTWTHLANKLKIPAEEYQKFDETRRNETSPTKEVLEWVAAKFPDITLSDVVKALEKIQRNDVIMVISREVLDTVASAIRPLDSSFEGSFSMQQNDPTGHTFSTSYQRENSYSGFLPMQEEKTPSGYCDNLPERVTLVGRDETCNQIMTLLDSNKAVGIVAPPGYGKTKSVVEVAYRMKERGMFVVYVNTNGVTCVEDLGGLIVEAMGVDPGDNTIKETLHRLRTIKSKNVLLIIENIDNLLHLDDDQLSKDKDLQESECVEYCAKMRGKYKKDDFWTFLKRIGETPNIHLILTSRENNDFGVSFPTQMFELQPLSDDESSSLFTKGDKSLKNDLIKELVKICGGIPLVICTVLTILQTENPEKFTRRLSNSSPRSLIKALCPDHIANEDRIDKCLQVLYKRLNQENQDVLVMIATFPHKFTQEQFLDVFRSSLRLDLQNCFSCLKHSGLLCFERMTCHYSLHPFIRKFFAAKPKHAEAKSVFIRHYSVLAVALYETFLSTDSESAIKRYRVEKENIREAVAWCGDDHPELDQDVREKCINEFNDSAVFLAKMMRKQEFESLFCKLAKRCRYDMHLHSACWTHIGVKIVLSCTCTPQICPTALYRAKAFLSRANNTQSQLAEVNQATRAQCLSKLGFCCVREGHFDEGFEHLNEALKLRCERAEKTKKTEDKVMLAACFNDLAASQMVQGKHLLAIQTRLSSVLPVYEEYLGDHPFLATTLNWIGNSHYHLANFDLAIKFTSKSLEIRERLLGHHQETARSFQDLGVAFTAIQDYESALKYLEKAVDLQEEVLDTYDELIRTHQAKAVVLYRLGRNEEAEEEIKRAGECAQNLDSSEAPIETVEIQEQEEDWMEISYSPSGELRKFKF